ncbi:MAG: hypothetical protein VX583_06885 [Bdellovibrionota bacterium]|nr:hypothetical protein [Pseudobdellovibrionaceae bacterium]
MGRRKRFEKALSKFLGTENFIFLSLAFLCACTSTSPKNPSYEAKNAIPVDHKKLEVQSSFLSEVKSFELPGNNFVSDTHEKDDRLLFFSSDRLSHKNYQIYELDLGTGKERRVTHQNGQAFQASYHPNNQHIIYASTTDYEKEDLSKLFEIDEAQNPEQSLYVSMDSLKSDLFISRLNGSNIIRATFIDTGEQFPQYHPKDYTIVYRLVRNNSSSIEAMTRFRKPLKALSERNGTRSFLRVSKTGKAVAWLNYSQDTGFSLETMDWKSKKLESYPIKNLEEVRSLTWMDDERILITGRFEDDDMPQLYSLKKDSSCITRLAQAEHGLQSAHVHKDSIYFTAFTGQQWQIYGARLNKKPDCN